MGPEKIQQKTAEPKIDSYSIISFQGPYLPEQYHSLIYSKWLRSYRVGNDYIRLNDPDAYYQTYKKIITNLIPHATIRLAVLTDDKDVVLGFSFSRGETLDYVYVHKDFRKMGIGTKLLPAKISVITHLTKTALTIWGSKYKHWKLNLFA